MNISPQLRKRLEELNALDIELYRWLHESWHTKRTRQPTRALPDISPWRPYNVSSYRTFSAPEFTLISAVLDGNNALVRDEPVSFTLTFSLSVAVTELVVGIQIFDAFGRMAFGTNTTLLKQTLPLIKAGTHCMRYCLIADLPEGKYTAGFAFIERNEKGERELAWYDTLLEFSVTVPRSQASLGYCSIPIEMNYQQINDALSIGRSTDN